MQLAYKFQHHEHKKELKEICSKSLIIYNKAIEITTNQPELRDYRKLNNYFKSNEPNLYQSFKVQVVQQKLMEVCKNWSTYFKALKAFSRNPQSFNFKKPNPPKIKTKIYQHITYFTNQTCQIKNNKLKLTKNLIIEMPRYKDFTKFQQVRILPKTTHYEIEIIYNEEKHIDPNLKEENKSSIDFGVNNLITLISTKNSKPLIISGKLIKSINQFYNKEKSRLQNKLPKGQYRSNRINKLETKRNDKITDIFHKVSKFVVNCCLKHGIGHLIVGYNKWWKDSINIGHQNNQKFYYIPYLTLINQIKYKCEMNGIKFEVTEESYTSKIDALALEPLEKQETYLGHRIKRGLFLSSIGKAINADVNGAINIMRKVVDESFVKKIVDNGLLYSPLKIKLKNADSLKSFLYN